MRIRLVWSLSLILPLLILAAVAGASPLQQDAIPPKVIETNPFVGEELLLDGSVTLYFDQAMDRASVEAALSITPEAGALGEIAWEDDLTLTISPQDAWTRNAELALRIDIGATNAEGVALADPYELDMQTIGFLEVAEVLPADGQGDIETSNVITVIFNRPVVPLVTVEEMDTLPDPLQITPSVEGEGEWLNTSIYIFRPEDGLAGGTDYTVTLTEGLTDVDGAVLEEDFTWTFSTLDPEVVEVRPGHETTSVALDRTVSVRFSQPMSEEETQEAITVTASNGIAVSGSYEWNENGRQVTFTPDDLLALDTEYDINVDRTIAVSTTGASLVRSFAISFMTVEPPRIVGTNPSNGAGDASPFGGFEIIFNVPIDIDTLEDKVVVQPQPWREFDTYFYDYNNRYSLFFDTEPSTDYQVIILPGIADPYGNTIDEQVVVEYTTAEYSPEVNLNTPGFVGLYSAHNPTTRVFATHRNVSRLNLALHEINMPTLARFLGDGSFDFRDTFVPPPPSLLRNWSINVQSQPNQRRYELLLLSAEGDDGIDNIQCLGAPDTRIQLGDVGRVALDDPRPLRVRSLPNLQGEIVTEIDPGVQFDVIDGPICADGYIWWNLNVQGSDIAGWSAEGTTQGYFIEMMERTGPVVENVDPADFPALSPGAYYLTMAAPEVAAQGREPWDHVALVSTLNVTIKFSPETVLAWVTDMQTGEPVADVPVQFHDGNFELMGNMRTNEDGIASLSMSRLPSLYTTLFAFVDSGDQFGFASSTWDSGLSPWTFGVNGDFEPENFAAYLYTDRPIYRPGQPVHFRGIMRDRNDVIFTLPGNTTSAPVSIHDPEGQVVFESTLSLTPHGTFSDSFTLDEEAALGFYRLVLETGSNRRSEFSLGFHVAEFVAPEFQVEVTPAQDAVAQGDEVEVLVESTFFFGGPVSDATVEWSLLTQNYFFDYDGPGRYDFVDYNYDEGPGEFFSSHGELIADGESTTDSEGNFLISVPADLGTRSQSQEYTIEARVIDESDQLVAGRATVIVHQGLVYVGSRPEAYISQAEQEATVNVIAVDWESEPVAGQEVEYEIVERRWSNVQEEDPTGRTVWTWDVEEIPIEDAEGTVATDADGLASITFVPPIAGTYKVYTTTHDDAGNRVRSSSFMWVSGATYVAWRQQNSNRFDLITDADTYTVGDTAEILIASPFQGETTALVTVERGDIIQHEVLRMNSNSEVFRLPITEEFAPNVFVSVLIVKGEDENNAYAEFRMGLVKLAVDTERLAMNVAVTPNIDVDAGEFAGPGDEVTYTVRTTDWQGEPVSAEVGIGVTDLSVLTITAANSGPLMEHFYSERGVSVRTSSALTVSVDKATQTIIDTVKGGGGGGADAGIFEIREEFVDTPGWEPSLVTDENGMATYTLTLPDNLTTWRLDARAITNGVDGPMLVGQNTFDLLSTKPLLLRPLTPRFLIVGDEVEFGAIVNNNTGEDQLVEISMQGTGFALTEGVELSQMVEIAAKSRQRVNWRVTVMDVPEIDLTFFANGNEGQFTDASKPTATQGDPLPVYKYEAPEVVGTGGALTGDEAQSRSELVALPRRFDVTQGELTVKMDRSLAGATVDGLDYLENFPHQCTEQTISRFLPNVVTARALSQLGVFDAELQANLDEAVNFALQRLYANQKVDGGWGWFPQNESNPLVTAYALIGFSEARLSGYPVDQNVVNDAAEFVQLEITEFRVTDPLWRHNRHAFLAYAMTRAGFFQTSAASVLYERRAGLNVDAKAFLALALAEMNPDDARLPTLVGEFVSGAALSATGAHWEDDDDFFNWTTDTRTTALVLDALIKLDPENQLIPQAVRWLMVARTADAWETTQETAWSVMTLTDWMVTTGELNPTYDFSVSLNGQAQELADSTATSDNATESEVLRIQVADLLADEANRLTFGRSAGQGNLYYTAHLEAFLPVPEVEAISRGVIIDRKYYAFGDDSRRPITSGRVGDQVEVVLTIIAPNDLHYVVVEDPIPAGSAAVDPNLSISSIVSQGPELSRPLSRGWGWWYFSRTEFRDEKVVMYADYLPRGTFEYRYTIRLGLQGEYNVIPPSGLEFYFPEVFGRGDGSTFTILPAIEEETVESDA